MTKMSSKLICLIKHSFPFLVSHPLWREGARYKPFLRFLRLQALFAFGEREVCMPWFHGLMLPVRKGDSGLSGNYYVGLHEFRDMAFVSHFLAPGDLFVDIGANLGSYSLIASGVCGASSISFEPVPSTFERLKHLVRVNSLDRLIEPRCCALSSGAEDGAFESLWFSTDRDTRNSFVGSDYAGDKQRVHVSSLDQQLSGRSPVLLKIDVEGFELAVLAGGRAVLARESVLAVVIEGQTDLVDQCLVDLGFVEVDYLPFDREVVRAPHLSTPNKIWVKRDCLHEVSRRLSKAPMRAVYGRKF